MKWVTKLYESTRNRKYSFLCYVIPKLSNEEGRELSLPKSMTITEKVNQKNVKLSKTMY